jgi:phage shock protein A
MRRLQRFTATCVSRFDRVVSQIENHDGLVSAAIRESEEARSRAKVQLGRVRRDAERMRQRQQELDERGDRWQERALRVSGEDEARALECLRRRKRALQELAALERQLEQHAQIEEQIRADMRRVDERIEALRQKRNLLRTRQSRAEALSLSRDEDGHLAGEIDEILERWETKVSHLEYRGDCSLSDDDDLDAGFASEEEEGALREELATLLQQGTEA